MRNVPEQVSGRGGEQIREVEGLKKNTKRVPNGRFLVGIIHEGHLLNRPFQHRHQDQKFSNFILL